MNIFRVAPWLRSRPGGLVCLLPLLAVAVFVAGSTPALSPETSAWIGGALLIGGAVAGGWLVWQQTLRRATLSSVRRWVEQDGLASMIADHGGRILLRNRAAGQLFADGKKLDDTLRGAFANPSAAILKMQRRAVQQGTASEEIATRRGPVRFSVQEMGRLGFLWRAENLARDTEAADGRAEILLPCLRASRSGAIISINRAASDLIGHQPPSLDRLFIALPIRQGELNDLRTAHGTLRALACQHTLPDGQFEVYLMPAGPELGSTSWAVIEKLPVALLKLEPDGGIVEANEAAQTLLGPHGGTGQRALAQVMEGLGRPITDWLRDVMQGQQGARTEFLRLSRADREVFVQVTLNRVSEEGRDVLIAVLSDATELKTLEAQFVQSQKMQAIGQLAGGIAHDFNNLLTAISGHCDLLLLRHDRGDSDFGDLVQINQNANRAAALVGQLLAFSRKQTLRPELLDMRETLADLTHLLNRLVGERVELTLCHDPVMGAIRADKRQLEQVLMNLVVNARDAMPEGGEIRIQTDSLVLGSPMRRSRAEVPEGEYVRVQVVDQGIGIPADKLEKVFEPFFTTKRTGEGTGLGLSTAYGIVKQTGGYIFLDSHQGKGTTFTLLFPVHHPEPAPLETQRPAPVTRTPSHGEGVVLLVEDEAPVRAFASRALQLRGYSVIEAESAEEALATLEDPDLQVDVFVTDVIMPGMDGPSWVRQALAFRPDVRVVFVSGYAEGAFRDMDITAPNAAFLPKPFSLDQLTEMVHRQLH